MKIKTTDMDDIKKKLKRKSKKKKIKNIYFYFPWCLMIIHKKFKNIRRGIWKVEDKNKLMLTYMSHNIELLLILTFTGALFG